MNWKQEEDRLVATTDFGDYVITMSKRPPFPEFEAVLHGNDAAEFKGTHSSIADATAAAETDMNHRMNMWETL